MFPLQEIFRKPLGAIISNLNPVAYIYLVGKKTSTRCLKDVLPRQARHLAKTSCRCPKDVLNANLKVIFVRHLEDTFARYIEDVLEKMS